MFKIILVNTNPLMSMLQAYSVASLIFLSVTLVKWLLKPLIHNLNFEEKLQAFVRGEYDNYIHTYWNMLTDEKQMLLTKHLIIILILMALLINYFIL